MTIVRAADIPPDELTRLPIADLRQQIRRDQSRHARFPAGLVTNGTEQHEQAVIPHSEGQEPDDSTERMEHVESYVLRRLGGRLCAFRILRQDDGLVLQGHAATYYAKQLAQHAAMEVARLPVRVNTIRVCDIHSPQWAGVKTQPQRFPRRRTMP